MNEEPQGCQHKEQAGETTCNKICDAGETLCPYHKLLRESQPIFPEVPKIPAQAHEAVSQMHRRAEKVSGAAPIAHRSYKTPRGYRT